MSSTAFDFLQHTLAAAPGQPSRHVPLEGASNFRDLGGYRTSAGQQVRWRTLFRSDRLSELTAADQATLAQLAVRHSIDFRGADEQRTHGYAIATVQRIAIPIEPQVVQDMQALLAAGDALDAPTAHRLMQQTYVAFVHENAAQYRQFFDVLLRHETPLLFHCTAGKDRTGFAAALLLELLGVPRATIEADYLLTNLLYRQPQLPDNPLPAPVLDVLWRVHPDFLHTAYREIEREWGSVQGYAAGALGLSNAAIAELRHRYLEVTPAAPRR